MNPTIFVSYGHWKCFQPKRYTGVHFNKLELSFTYKTFLFKERDVLTDKYNSYGLECEYIWLM